jgi:peptidoglycan/LPS O-acetylase OafA/YrhL
VGIATLAIFSGIFIRAVFAITGYQLVNSGLRYATPFVLGPIAMGRLLAIAGPWVRRFILQMRKWMGLATPLAVVAILLMDTVHVGSANRFRNIIMDVLLTFVVARFIFVPTGLVAACLNSRPLIFIGKLSYSVYLWQQLFMNPVSTALICKFPLNVIATFGAACVSYFMIETRFLKLRKRFRRGPVVTAATMAPSLT